MRSFFLFVIALSDEPQRQTVGARSNTQTQGFFDGQGSTDSQAYGGENRRLSSTKAASDAQKAGRILPEATIVSIINEFVRKSQAFRAQVGMVKSAGGSQVMGSSAITQDLEGNPYKLKQAGTFQGVMGNLHYVSTRKGQNEMIGQGDEATIDGWGGVGVGHIRGAVDARGELVGATTNYNTDTLDPHINTEEHQTSGLAWGAVHSKKDFDNIDDNNIGHMGTTTTKLTGAKLDLNTALNGNDAEGAAFYTVDEGSRVPIPASDKDDMNSILYAKEYLSNLVGYYEGNSHGKRGYNPETGTASDTPEPFAGELYHLSQYQNDENPLLCTGGTCLRSGVPTKPGTYEKESRYRTNGQFIERKWFDADVAYKLFKKEFEKVQFNATRNTTELLDEVAETFDWLSAHYADFLRNVSIYKDSNSSAPIDLAKELEENATAMRVDVVGALAEEQKFFDDSMASTNAELRDTRLDNDQQIKDRLEAHTADWEYIGEQIEQYQDDEREYMKGPKSIGVKTRDWKKEIGDLRVQMNNGRASLTRNAAGILRESRAALRKLDKTNSKILKSVYNDHDVAKRFITETKAEMKQEQQEVKTSKRMLDGLASRVAKMEEKAYNELHSKIKMQKASVDRMMKAADYKTYPPDGQTPALLKPFADIIGVQNVDVADDFDLEAGDHKDVQAKPGTALDKFYKAQEKISDFKLELAKANKKIAKDFDDYVTAKKNMMVRAVKKHNEAMYTKYTDQVKIALADANMLAKRLVNNFHRLNTQIVQKAEGTSGTLPARISALQEAITLADEKLTGGELSGKTGEDPTSVKAMLLDLPDQVQNDITTAEKEMANTKTTKGPPGALTYLIHAKDEARKKLDSYTSEEKRGAYAEMMKDVDTQVDDFKSTVAGQVRKLDTLLDTNKANTETLLNDVNAQFKAQISSLGKTIGNLKSTLDFIEKTTVPDIYKYLDGRMKATMEGPLPGGNPGFLQASEDAGLETHKIQEKMLEAMDAESKKTMKGLGDYVKEIKKGLATSQSEVQAEYEKAKNNAAMLSERAESQLDKDESNVDETGSEAYKESSNAKSMMNGWHAQLQEAKQDTQRMEKQFVAANDHTKKSAETASERFLKDLGALTLPSSFTRDAQHAVDDNKRKLNELRDESLEKLEESLERMESGLYPSERDLDVFNNLYKNVKDSFSTAEIMATAGSKKLFKQVANLERGLQTQDIVNAQSDRERLAILNHRTEQLKAALAKKKNDMLSGEYDAAQKAIQDTHDEMKNVITEAEGWSKGQTDALQAAEKKLFAVGGELDHAALEVAEEAAGEAHASEHKQSNMLRDLVGYQSDVALTHSEEAVETKTEHEEANEQFATRVAAISDAMNIVEGELKPRIEKHIDNLNQRWTESMKHWEEREGTMFAPEERQLSDLKDRIQDEMRTMENALKPMEDRYRSYGDLVTNKKHEATEQETTFKQKLADENTDFEKDAQSVSKEAVDGIALMAEKVQALSRSLANVTDEAQEAVDDHAEKQAHYGDAEERMLGLKFNGEASELKAVVGDIQELDANHTALSKWAHTHDAKAAAWRNIVETKLSDMGRDVESMQSIIASDSSLAARALRRAAAKYGDMVQKEMTEEQRRMDKQVQSVYEHFDLKIQQLQANQQLDEADRARLIAELKEERASKIRDIHNAAAEAKAAEAERDAKAERFKQQVANVVDKLHAQTSGMGGSADVTNRTAEAVATAAEQVHRLSLSPALEPVSFVEEGADRTTLQLERANRELRAEDAVLEEQLASLRGKLHPHA